MYTLLKTYTTLKLLVVNTEIARLMLLPYHRLKDRHLSNDIW